MIPLADALSQKFHDHHKALYVEQTIRHRSLIMINPALNGYKFFADQL